MIFRLAEYITWKDVPCCGLQANRQAPRSMPCGTAATRTSSFFSQTVLLPYTVQGDFLSPTIPLLWGALNIRASFFGVRIPYMRVSVRNWTDPLVQGALVRMFFSLCDGNNRPLARQMLMNTAEAVQLTSDKWLIRTASLSGKYCISRCYCYRQFRRVPLLPMPVQ